MFNAWPYGSDKHIGKTARLEYEVFFPNNFPFVKGGKLPGLAGGQAGECGGGEHSNDCWSGTTSKPAFLLDPLNTVYDNTL